VTLPFDCLHCPVAVPRYVRTLRWCSVTFSPVLRRTVVTLFTFQTLFWYTDVVALRGCRCRTLRCVCFWSPHTRWEEREESCKPIYVDCVCCWLRIYGVSFYCIVGCYCYYYYWLIIIVYYCVLYYLFIVLIYYWHCFVIITLLLCTYSLRRYYCDTYCIDWPDRIIIIIIIIVQIINVFIVRIIIIIIIYWLIVLLLIVVRILHFIYIHETACDDDDDDDDICICALFCSIVLCCIVYDIWYLLIINMYYDISIYILYFCDICIWFCVYSVSLILI